jgi:hypothetical protein
MILRDFTMNGQQLSQIESLEQLLAWMLPKIENPEIRRDLAAAKKCFHAAICKQLEE